MLRKLVKTVTAFAVIGVLGLAGVARADLFGSHGAYIYRIDETNGATTVAMTNDEGLAFVGLGLPFNYPQPMGLSAGPSTAANNGPLPSFWSAVRGAGSIYLMEYNPNNTGSAMPASVQPVTFAATPADTDFPTDKPPTSLAYSARDNAFYMGFEGNDTTDPGTCPGSPFPNRICVRYYLKVDGTTGQAVAYGRTHATSIGRSLWAQDGLAVDPTDNKLYGSDNDNEFWYEIDQTTISQTDFTQPPSSVSVVQYAGLFADGGRYPGLAGSADTLYGITRYTAGGTDPIAEAGDLFIRDIPSTVVTEVGKVGPEYEGTYVYNGLARVIPEPATLVLLGLGGLAVLRRRRG